ncbi:MAG: hypothetical protein LUC43_08595 [Burkholderiales bacterium]|nr:hypothetical protein [Burkholderiales bacterium]
MKLRKKAFLLAVVPLVFATWSVQAGSARIGSHSRVSNSLSRPILGTVTLGETTISQFVMAMKAKGCRLNYETETEAEVAAGCFQLPGNPEVGVGWLYQLGQPRKINMVVVQYKKTLGQNTFNAYLNALKKRYGQPSKIEPGSMGDVRQAAWQKPGMVILLNEEKKSPEGTLVYGTPELFAKLERTEEQRMADLDRL